ncbi:hypothetical protein ACTA71_009597 [Dictyostelium dimigraforme]
MGVISTILSQKQKHHINNPQIQLKIQIKLQFSSPSSTSATMFHQHQLLSVTHQPDKTIKDIINSTRASIKTRLGTNNVIVVSYKTQDVNGINYFIKVKTDGYAHFGIYKPISGFPSLVSAQTSNIKDEEIIYF